jgi:hypothetical protein
MFITCRRSYRDSTPDGGEAEKLKPPPAQTQASKSYRCVLLGGQRAAVYMQRRFEMFITGVVLERIESSLAQASTSQQLTLRR